MVKERVQLFLDGQADNYKLLFIDYSMPVKDGPQVAKEIRSIFEQDERLGHDQIPYICCATAYAEASFKKKAL